MGVSPSLPAKKKPVPADPCAPFIPLRSSPPSPGGSFPTIKFSTPIRRLADRPPKRRNPYDVDPDQQKAALAMVQMFSDGKLIINKDADTISITPNGAAADAAKSQFHIRSTETKYSLIITGMGDATKSFFVNYFTVNKRPDIPATSEISVHSGTAILKYDSKEEWELTSKHRWGVGKVWIPDNFDPTKDYDCFYRVCFTGADFSRIDNLDPRVKAYFAAQNIAISHAAATKNPEIMQAYILTATDWARYKDFHLASPLFFLPAFGRDVHPTPVRALPALTATNNPEFARLFVGNVSAGAEEYLVCERFCVAAEEGGFPASDVITFGAYRYPGSTKTSRYGYLYVRGMALAKHLVSAKIDTADGVFEVDFSQEDAKPKPKKQRRN